MYVFVPEQTGSAPSTGPEIVNGAPHELLTTGGVGTKAQITSKLSDLYARQADYQNAFKYSKIYQTYNEELKELAKQREVTLLGLEREKRKHEKDLQAVADEDLRRRNLQYTGISMATAFLFIVLIVFGMFPISRTTIRMLNFVSFICLFEFSFTSTA